MLEFLEYEFFRNALWGVLIISVSAAMIGTYIITRRLVAISGGITHACFGGLGLGYFLGISPVLMAAVFAVASSIGVEWMSSRFRVREDSAIAVVWAIGMAIGVLFVFLTPGYVPELNSFLFGNILTITRSDIWVFAAFAAVLIIFFALFYQKILACAFDRDFARVIHLPERLINYTMTVLVAVCIVLTIRLVGVMLLMSMLSLPMMSAEIYFRRFKTMMIASVIISLVCCVAGLFIGAMVDVPCSAIIVIIMVIVFTILKASSPWLARE
ncbi:MAG: metal ABC transporter permease [Bacteroidales bacterium]|nr:metal ABC transporter permease [Bacteroidales bacterium]